MHTSCIRNSCPNRGSDNRIISCGEILKEEGGRLIASLCMHAHREMSSLKLRRGLNPLPTTSRRLYAQQAYKHPALSRNHELQPSTKRAQLLFLTTPASTEAPHCASCLEKQAVGGNDEVEAPDAVRRRLQQRGPVPVTVEAVPHKPPRRHLREGGRTTCEKQGTPESLSSFLSPVLTRQYSRKGSRVQGRKNKIRRSNRGVPRTNPPPPRSVASFRNQY